MNVNGARFQLLLGQADWGRCLDGEAGLPLAAFWDEQASPQPSPPATAPAWDGVRNELTLQPQPIALPATATETAFTLQSRRGAAADRNGNIYRVADDSRSLRVLSAGSGNDSLFWPVPDSGHSHRDSFQPRAPQAAPPQERYRGVVVTSDDYLVVAYERAGAQRGLLSFDLIAGGPPNHTAWPSAIPCAAFDLCKREGGGLWLLDHENSSLWELDCTLAVVRSGQPLAELAAAEPDDFQPLAGTPRTRPAQPFPGGLPLQAAPFNARGPIAIDTLADGSLLLLDRDEAARRSRVMRLRRQGEGWSCQSSGWLDALPAPAHDLLVAAGASYQQAPPLRLWLTTTIGNQAHAWRVDTEAGHFRLHAAPELFPLRRHAGRALVAVQGRAFYDSGPATPVWTQIVQQPRARYADTATLVTPVFDSADLGTVWDKLLIDACIPADTDVRVESRAGDEVDITGTPQVVGAWSPEPGLRLRSEGPELPWLRAEAAPATRRDSGTGTWELLLQNAQGRHAQLRLTLTSRNGTGTPRLRALRLWSPRFSYVQRFLPAVYREDSTGGPFLERWLANFESTLTQLEDRVAQVQSLFDPRSVPAETLPWLAEWLDLALDPAWDERRQRLFLRHAMDFFRWRGTLHGLRLALAMAFDPCIDESAFATPQAALLSDNAGPRQTRIVEAYQTRLIGALAAGDAGAAGAASAAGEGPREVPLQALWTPAEGNAGLAERWARQREGRAATALEQITPVALVLPAPAGLDAAAQTKLQQDWRSFASAAFGFVPAAGAAERARWQAFLSAVHGDVQQLNLKHGSAYASLTAVPLPPDVPAAAKAAKDWSDFCERTNGAWARGRWQDFLARRYRRIERLQRAHRVAWTSFEQVPLPDVLPATPEAQTDWLQFEGRLLAMHRTAHRFSVLLPVASVVSDPAELEQRLGLARRIVDLEKPAHTVFDVRFFWAFNRVGEARLGLDTQLGAGSRASELVPDAVLGRAYLGASFVGGPARPTAGDRLRVDC